MVESARKLSIEELSMVAVHPRSRLGARREGQGPRECRSLDGHYEQQIQPVVAAQRIGGWQTKLLPVTSRASSGSFPLRSSWLDESEDGAEESQNSRSQTVSLSSISSTSKWSFACRCARRVERDEEGVDNLQEDASCSAGSRFMSDEEFHALPDWSDVEGDSEYNVHFEQDSDVWSGTTGASADLDGIMAMPAANVSTGAFESTEEAEAEAEAEAEGDEVLI